jgi:hypothetical protein
VLQTSDESLDVGRALRVHEKPIDEPVQPTIDLSTLHPDVTKVSLMQQKSVRPPLLGVPTLQLRLLELSSSGLESPVHEYPVELPTHPTTLPSCMQVDGIPFPGPPATVVEQADIPIMITRTDH